MPYNLHFHSHSMLVNHAILYFITSCHASNMSIKDLILETLCISSNVCLDNHMKPFTIIFHYKSDHDAKNSICCWMLTWHWIACSIVVKFSCTHLHYLSSFPFFRCFLILYVTSLSNAFVAWYLSIQLR
jgi:hypothetical protein